VMAECEFCHSTEEMRLCNGHLHCAHCNRPTEECCEEADAEPYESFDLSDDDDALGSAGMGTDEYYGFYGDE